MRVPPEWDRPRPLCGQAASYYPPLLFPQLAEEERQPKSIAESHRGNYFGAYAGAAQPPQLPSNHMGPSRLEASGPADRTAVSSLHTRTPPVWPEGSGRLPPSPLRERPQHEQVVGDQDQLLEHQFPSAGSRGRSQNVVAEASSGDAFGSQQQVEVRASRGEAPGPWRTWQDVVFPSRLLSPLVGAGFQAPTVIQQHAWAIVTQAHDMIGIAKTGSGKTLAFLLPAFSRVLGSGTDLRAPPAILVLCPTRELACQIEAEAKKFGTPAGIRTACLYGGAPKGPQLAELRQRPQLVVATPGRLNDLLEPPPGMTLGVDIKSVRFLVLDEADRMLDMGFEPQIRKIINSVPQERQTMMFTATWPPSVRRLALEFMKDPIEVRVGDTEKLTVNPDIEQRLVFINDQLERQNRLDELIREAGEDQVIVFVNTKRLCDSISFRIPSSIAIHGDKDQRERDAALAAFKSGAKRVLVATDVAARGLDIKSVRRVINFEPPNNSEDYVHRVGRTGRAGLKGVAVTMLSNEDGSAAIFIAEIFRSGSLQVPEELERRLASGEMRSGGGGRSRSQSRGPMRRPGGAFGHDDDFDFGDVGGGRFSGGFGRSAGMDIRNNCSNDCPTSF